MPRSLLRDLVLDNLLLMVLPIERPDLLETREAREALLLIDIESKSCEPLDLVSKSLWRSPAMEPLKEPKPFDPAGIDPPPPALEAWKPPRPDRPPPKPEPELPEPVPKLLPAPELALSCPPKLVDPIRVAPGMPMAEALSVR